MTDQPKASPGKKAIDYAEKQLGVHSSYEAANKAKADLDRTLTELSDARDILRDVESRLEDATLLVASNERGKHPDMSQAMMDKHMKIALSKDDSVRELREQLAKIRGDIDGLEMDETMAERTIKIETARMSELGGYFQYLAVVKQIAESAKEKDVPSAGASVGPWT